MSRRVFIDWVAMLPWWVPLAALLAPPLIAWVMGCSHGRGNGAASPWKYMYSVLVYWVCLPGVLAAVVSGYTLFFVRENLLDKNLVLYFLPVVSMVVTLVLIGKNVSFDDVPGFDRLSGLITVVAVTFIAVLAVEKTRVWLVFGASIFVLGALVVGLLALLQWGMYTLFRRSGEPKRDPSAFRRP